MEQIKEDYVSDEITKLARSKGFPYDMETAPKGTLTQALVIKWLRIKHDIIVLPDITVDPHGNWYYCKVIHKYGYKHTDGSFIPEEATEQAILYCLQNLIK